MHTPNTFPLKRRGTEGVKKRLKKKKGKEERRRGREGERSEFEKKRKKEKDVIPSILNTEAEPWSQADRERSKSAWNATRRRGFGRDAAAFSELSQINESRPAAGYDQQGPTTSFSSAFLYKNYLLFCMQFTRFAFSRHKQNEF